MSTVPTEDMERKLRKLYLQWLAGVTDNLHNLPSYVDRFREDSLRLLGTEGAKVVRRGAKPGFPTPEFLSLSSVTEEVYNSMKRHAIQAGVLAGVASGLNPRDISQQMLKVGLDTSYNRLERIARTEAVSAYWQHQWDSVEGTDLVMVWSSEESARTCPWCLAKDGLVVKDKSIRDHPNGRCTLIPTLPQDVGIRSKSKNPHFNRKKWDGDLPQEVRHILGHGLDTALVKDLSTQQALGLMVSQGWSSAEAFRYLWDRWETKRSSFDLDRKGYSQILRSLEHHAQEMWERMSPGKEDIVLYRGGVIPKSGVSSWTPVEGVARLYALRNKSSVLTALVPKQVLRIDLNSTNPHQKEILLMGNLAPNTGALDAPITMFTYRDYITDGW